MRCPRHEIELIPLVELRLAGRSGQLRVHGLAYGLSVVHRGAGGDRGIGLPVVVDQLAARLLERLEVGQCRLQGVVVADHARFHPVDEGVVGDIVEVREVGEVEKLYVLSDEHAACPRNAKVPLVSPVVVRGFSLAEIGADLPRQVGSLVFGVEQSLIDLLSDSDVLLSHLSGLCGCGRGVPFAIAKAETERRRRGGQAVVRGAYDGVEVEVKLAEVGAGNDAVTASVIGVALVDNLRDNFR